MPVVPGLTCPGNWSWSSRSCCASRDVIGAPGGGPGVDLRAAGGVRAGVVLQAGGPGSAGRRLRDLYRYRDEALEVLAAQALDLTAALERVAAEGWSHVVLDGTVVESDRCAAKTTSSKGEQIDLWCSEDSRLRGQRLGGTASGRPAGLDLRCSSRVGPRPHRRPPERAGSLVRRRSTWTAHPGRRRVRRCRSGCVHPGQTTPAEYPWRSTTAPTTHS